jgi:transcriptional regulator with XRE-family HTH domain
MDVPKGQFGKIMKTAMKEKQLSTRDLAERMSCTYNHLNLCGNGERPPSDKMLRRICLELDLDYDRMHPYVQRHRLELKSNRKLK